MKRAFRILFGLQTILLIMSMIFAFYQQTLAEHAQVRAEKNVMEAQRIKSLCEKELDDLRNKLDSCRVSK